MQATARQAFNGTVNEVLCSHAHLQGCTLEWRGAPISAEEVFDDGHLMPVVTQIAAVKGLELMGWNLDVSNQSSKDGLLGMRSVIPHFDNFSTSDTVRGLFYLHAAEKVFGLSRGGIIECFPVYEFFKLDLPQRAIESKKYTIPLAKATHRNVSV